MADALCKAQPGIVYFEEDPGVTDFVFLIEDKKIHVTKSILMRASPVFRAMFTSDIKERNESTIQLQDKNYEDFVLFLRCFYPGEYVELNDSLLAQVLPLAKEYKIETLLASGHEWLQREAKAHPNNIPFLMKCFHFAVEFEFITLYTKMLNRLKDVNLSVYKNDKFYKSLQLENKAILLEAHCKLLETENDSLETKNEKLSKTLDSIKSQVPTQITTAFRLETHINLQCCPYCRPFR
ncbi:BTB and MATH domain-containing protein 38-like [Saccostrea cucullata]|uniref:BTB and MATH domain-containing protein 38-like n=1 Tax=Saccostrea cuccullata TaxID=36930 RepID=UPI002ED5F19B